jgi:ATP adenylyltransferase
MNNNQSILFEKGTLRQTLAAITQRAISIGALVPIPTGYDFIEDGGVRFFVRILKSLALKDEEKKKQEAKTKTGTQGNPFLPYEKDLFIADISPTHVAILNKFNVVEQHLLIVTREFENQRDLLTVTDFEALWACLTEYESLGFYNGGEAAGASQPHKHLQVVPLPLAPEGSGVPIESLIISDQFSNGLGTIPGLPFLHVFVRFGGDTTQSLKMTAEHTFVLYCDMLRFMGLQAPAPEGRTRQSGPYCLLVTREWMLLVPRSKEFFEGISINSLGFAGALLVRDEQQMEILRKYGPMSALKAVALPLKKAL